MNKKIRTYILCLVLIITALCLFSCNGQSGANENKEIDIEKMAGEILAKQPFTEEVIERGIDDIVQYGYLYGYEAETENVISYVGGGATPQELLIIKAKDADGAKEIITALESYRNKQITIYKPYAADEVPNLENAVIKSSGSYVVYCVSKGDVSDIVNSFFK